MRKPLHELLRGLGLSMLPLRDRYMVEENYETMYCMADEIERYYYPLPRFEDGNPVTFGEKTEYGTYIGFVPYLDPASPYAGSVGILTIENAVINVPIDEPLKRVEPRCLAADGLGLYEGDWVIPDEWGDTVCEVISLETGNPDTVITMIGDGDFTKRIMKASKLTHVEKKEG